MTRAAERYGVSITGSELAAIAAKVRKSEGKFLRRLSLTKTEWLVEWNGQMFRVGYNRVTKQIVTFLPQTDDKGDA